MARRQLAADGFGPVDLRLMWRFVGIAVEQDYRGNMKRRMQRANKVNARAVIILGDDELTKGVAQLKDLDSGTQREVPLDGLAAALKV